MWWCRYVPRQCSFHFTRPIVQTAIAIFEVVLVVAGLASVYSNVDLVSELSSVVTLHHNFMDMRIVGLLDNIHVCLPDHRGIRSNHNHRDPCDGICHAVVALSNCCNWCRMALESMGTILFCPLSLPWLVA